MYSFCNSVKCFQCGSCQVNSARKSFFNQPFTKRLKNIIDKSFCSLCQFTFWVCNFIERLGKSFNSIYKRLPIYPSSPCLQRSPYIPYNCQDIIKAVPKMLNNLCAGFVFIPRLANAVSNIADCSENVLPDLQNQFKRFLPCAVLPYCQETVFHRID